MNGSAAGADSYAGNTDRMPRQADQFMVPNASERLCHADELCSAEIAGGDVPEIRIVQKLDGVDSPPGLNTGAVLRRRASTPSGGAE